MPTDIAALLAEAAWLTRLARSLAADPADAADAVQETWIAALRSPPDPTKPARPWLRRVLVNTLRMRHRGASRRAANEQVVELLERAPSTPDQLLARAQIEGRLATLVVELDEPFRTTVLLRYREGLTAEAIAKQQGIPAATVRTRLKTALDRLRRDIDDAESSRAWRALFAPIAAKPISWRRIVMAKIATKTGIAICVLVALALLVGGIVWSRQAHQDDDTASEPASGIALHARSTAAAWDPTVIFAQSRVPARSIAGHVTDGKAPLAGAVVHLSDAATRTAIAELTTGADGAFTFGSRAAVGYVVVATAPDKTAASLAVDLRAPAPADHLELALGPCTSKLVGVVQDASGGVISHAHVARDDAPWPSTETDVNGRYELCLPFGNTAVEFSAEGYAGQVLGVDIDRTTRRDVALIPEATVAGTVVNARGEPIAGAWVTVDPHHGSQPNNPGGVSDAYASGFSDTDGTFRIARVAPGRNRVAAFTPDGTTASPVAIVAIAGRVIENVVVRVDPGATLTGVVRAAGAPVAGAAVGLRSGNKLVAVVSDSRYAVLARTQADGRFTITRVPHGELAITVADHAVLAPRSVNLSGAEHADVQVDIAAPGAITGRVVRAGKVFADAQINCDGGRSYTRSDHDGRYVCRDLPPGRYELMAAVGDGAWGVTKPIAVGAGETIERDIVLEYNAELCGRVVDERRVPFLGVDVRIDDGAGDSATGTSDDDGRFCGRFLTGGRYTVVASWHGQPLAPVIAIAPVNLPRPDGHATIELVVKRPDRAIAGTVVDSANLPVPDAIVRVVPARAGSGYLTFGSGPAMTATTDAAGAFRLGAVAEGSYSLVASGRDGGEAVIDQITAGDVNLKITLDPAGAVEGRLVGFTHTPTVVGTIVRGSRGAFDVQVDGDHFRADGLSPGLYVLTANTAFGEGTARQITIAPDRTVTADLTSTGTGSVAIKAFDFRTHAPLAGLRCFTLARAGDLYGAMFTAPDTMARTDATGLLVLDPAPAGDILVACGGHGSGQRLVTLTPRQRLDVEMPMAVRTNPEESALDLGMELDPIHRVSALVRGGIAERAGLAIGDRIATVDGADVTQLSADTVLVVVGDRPAGGTAALTIERAGQRRSITLVLAP